MHRFPVYMVLGSGGVLGETFLYKLSDLTPRLFAFTHEQADITNATYINSLIDYIRPTVLLNCAAVSDEDICQDAKTGAFNVNAKGPQILAEACKKYRTKLVHFSSVSVFNGETNVPYKETDKPNPINVYGESKLGGEEAIKSILDDYLIIRPGFLFSFFNDSPIVNWLKLMEEDEAIPVLNEHMVSPTYLLDLIEYSLELIDKNAKGIFHICNSDYATRKTFVETMLSLSGMSGRTVTVKNDHIQKFFKAPVPKYAVLNNKKYQDYMEKGIRSWTDALKHCLFTMELYSPTNKEFEGEYPY